MILKASTNPRNILSHPLLGLSIKKVMLDGFLFPQYKMDTVNTPCILTWDEAQAPFWTPSPINMFGLKKWMVIVDHKAGKQLVVKSNLELVEVSKMDLSEEFHDTLNERNPVKKILL